jgi:hypothetical protein
VPRIAPLARIRYRRAASGQEKINRGALMAEETELRQYQQTYGNFVRLLVYCSGFVIILLVLMALFLL